MSQLVHPSTGRRATNIEDSRDIETCPNLCAAHCKGTDLSLTREFCHLSREDKYVLLQFTMQSAPFEIEIMTVFVDRVFKVITTATTHDKNTFIKNVTLFGKINHSNSKAIALKGLNIFMEVCRGRIFFEHRPPVNTL